MHDVLKSLGFNVRYVIARVVNNQDIDAPRTHRVTLLEFENNLYLVDVGFGSMCPTLLLKIETSKEEKKYKIVLNKDDDYQLEVLKGNSYFSLYAFNLATYTESDCIVGNFYSYKYPKSVFVNNLVVSLIFADKTLSLRNKSFHIIDANSVKIKNINSYKLLYTTLNNHFNIKIGKDESKIIFAKLL